MRKFQVPLWGCALACALAGPARAGEPVEATPTCGHCGGPATAYYPAPVTACRPVVVYQPYTTYRVARCYDPCVRVGPVRRVIRRVFLPPCPRPCPAPCAVPLCSGGPGPAPVATVPFSPPPPPPPPPAPASPFPAPADLGRPVPAPFPAPTAPPPAAEAPVTGSSYPRLTPPVSEPPIRADRIASTGGLEATVVTASRRPLAGAEVTLVSARQPDLRERLVTDSEGRLDLEMPGGDYLIYTRGPDGRWVAHGRIQVREHHTAKVTLIEK